MAVQTKIFPYVLTKGGTLVPWIPVSLGSKKTQRILKQHIFALVDSGADDCLCSEEIAAYLGEMILNKKKHENKLFTAANGNNFLGYKIFLTLFACGRSYQCPFFVTNSLPPSFPLILGQNGFFSEHVIKFNFKTKEIVIYTN